MLNMELLAYIAHAQVIEQYKHKHTCLADFLTEPERERERGMEETEWNSNKIFNSNNYNIIMSLHVELFLAPKVLILP